LNSKGNTIFWAIIACLLWSTAYAGIKLGLKYDTPFHFSGIRFIISGLIILPFTVKPSTFITMIIENWKVVAWVTFLQIVVNYSLFYHGLNLVPGALGAVIYGAQPLIIAIVAAGMHKDDKLTRKKILTILFGISGVILISAGRQAFKLGTALELLGIGMILIANVATGISNVMISLRSKDMNPFVLSSSSLFFGGIILYLISIPVEGRPTGPFPTEYWIILAWLCFMAASAFSIWYKLLQRPGVRVSELNLWKFLTPVSGAALSWLLIPDEHPEWLTISGMIIITISLIVYYTNNKDDSTVLNNEIIS
jgi:drug/metabolite transporter (DMT)-like permease